MEQGNNQVFYRTDVTFDEYNFRLSPERAGRDVEAPTVEVDVGNSGRRANQPVKVPADVPVEVTARLPVTPEVVTAPCEPEPVAEHSRPIRERKQVVRYGVEEQMNIAEEVIASALCAAELEEPKTMTEARRRPDASKWLQAAQDEMSSLIEHDTWALTKPPPGSKIIGSKWVFKIKHDENGEAAKYKCRLVAQGYTQAQGIDYHETFAPVARFGSIRTLLATSAQREMHVHQMDVHTAFLNGKLDEDIYMCQSEGFVVKGKEDMVCHLHRSLYGLKQLPRCWNKELSCHLFQSGFQQSKAYPCVFFQWKDGHLNIVSIYVDDLILVVDLMKDLLKTKAELSSRFKMKDLGQLQYCLGIVCEQADGCICINQRPYIDNLVRRFGLLEACGVSTPADACVKLVADDGVSRPADPKLYQQIVGSLQYAAGGTRPDIAYAVSTIAKFCHQPTELHMTAAKRVLRYLKQTRDLILTYVKNTPKAIMGYSDADWAGDVKDRRSTSGNVFLPGGGGAITWSSRKQSSVAISTVHGFKCCYARSHLAQTTAGGVRCDRSWSHTHLRRQPRGDLHGKESCLP